MMAWCKDCGGQEHIGSLCPPVTLKAEPVFEAPKRMLLVETPAHAKESWVKDAFLNRQTVTGACTCTTRFHDTPDCPIHDKTREQFADAGKYHSWARERDSLIDWAARRMGPQPVRAWR